MLDSGKEAQAFSALEEFISATATARTELGKLERYLRQGRQLMMDGETLESFIASKPPAKRRQAAWDALDELNRARHKARERVFALAVERGVSVTQLAQAWGFSRQLASRYIHENPEPVEARGPGPISDVHFDEAYGGLNGGDGVPQPL